MKPIAIVFCIALSVALSGCTRDDADKQSSSKEATPVAEHVPSPDTSDADVRALLSRLETPAAAHVFRQYNATSGKQIQDHLGDIYGANPEFQQDAGGQRRLLTDNVVGPVTLKWLTQFCRDYGIVASDPNFERAVVASLEQVALIATAYPDWVQILSSAGFEEWIAGQPDPARKLSLQRRRSGDASQVIALIRQYRSAPPPVRRGAAPIELTFGYDPKRTENSGDLAAVAQLIGRLSGRPPVQESIFEEDVREELKGIVPPKGALALVKRHSRVDAYLVSDELLQRLQAEGMPEAAVIALKKVPRKEYADALEFQDVLSETAAADGQLEAVENKMLDIVRGARVVRYQVPAEIADKLAAGGQPDPALAVLFAGLEDAQYPTRELFDAALDWQVRRALGMCPDVPQKRPVEDMPGGLQGKLDEPGLAQLKALMHGDEASFKRIVQLRARYGCNAAEQLQADEIAYRLARDVIPRLEGEMDFEMSNTVPARAVRKKKNWAPDWCRCARPNQDGMVYGFYPLWLDAGERQIDFGSLTRIGLYGVTVDNSGALRGPPGMEKLIVPDHLASMMRAAHRHDVKVDWVVSRSDWSEWGTLTVKRKQEVLKALEEHIEGLLGSEPDDGGQAAIWLASLGQDAGPTGGDGVVLYFRDFPAVDKDLYNAFVIDLHKRLDKMNPKRRISMAVDYKDLGRTGPFAYRNLIDLIKEVNPVEATFADSGRQMGKDIPILALLQEPTRDSKKALRTGIQNALHGADAARLQWTLAPVVAYDGVGSAQLADDIVFAAANYRGIGFWPLAFAGVPDEDDKLKDNDANRLLKAFLQPFGDPTDNIIYRAGILCPYRLELRWLFWGSLALAIGVGAVYFNCRGCNERVDNSGLYFAGMLALLALPLVTLGVLVVSDPLLTGYLKYTLALYGTGGIVAAALVSRYYFKKSRRKLP
ncbi:hypothetical protein [Massilia sp. CFBP9026]|uniref:hypothetical protein n=1 Tax=Massilia sp. CFBP9026 TaxID=3096536 RepID=UPI002A6A9763|nr:hypothetical protein [Massilia sp. CFBP9026]MDY0961172.1 hypothetical protein [Massilia sp. CFBP9026]